ncbi:MAG TPA: hypothetical protein VJM31_16395, partial [Vicinamibacterales bacterium]|nr:hypothetical protein [Vicinamibacterales bacterium]
TTKTRTTKTRRHEEHDKPRRREEHEGTKSAKALFGPSRDPASSIEERSATPILRLLIATLRR